MHSTIQQQSNNSSKSANGATVISSLKSSPDSMQNSSSYSSQAKGKKRDRTDQNSESAKRERSKKHQDGDLSQPKSENSLKSEVARIAEKGGLVDSETVERLVQLMQRDKSQRKIDLSCRSLIAGLLAATEKFDCLNHFVQLRGFVVLDEWLQEVHKGKTGYSGAVKDSDKSVDDFLLVLLRALDKLPINLNALKLCNIGKSVNHLRSHRNSEIQKKSRSLVDTWKKRVEAEMNSDEGKSTSSQSVQWAGRARHEGPHGGNRHGVLSPISAVKNPAHVTTSKSTSVKHVHGENAAKASSASSGPQKSLSPPTSSAANIMEEQNKAVSVCGHSEPAQVTAKDDRSSTSSHSQTNSHCSSDIAVHTRNSVTSEKEDARSSTARSKSTSKSSGSTRPSKSSNLHRPSSLGVPKETTSGEICTNTRDSNSERVSQSNNIAAVDTLAAPVMEGNSHKIIVKISNHGRSSGKSNHTGPAEDVSCMNSRASSPDCSQKLDHSDCSSSKRNISCQGSEFDGLPSDGKQCTAGIGTDSIEQPNVYRVTCSPSKKDVGSGLVDSSSGAVNPSYEISLKHMEGTTLTVGCDEVGMNPVASEGVPKCCSATPAVSPLRDLPKVGNPSSGSHGTPVTGGASAKSKEDLLQQEESSLKSLRKLDELVGEGSVPVSSTCTGEKIGNTVAAHFHASKPLVNDESPGLVGDTTQTAMGFVSAEDVVEDKKGPGKGPDVAMQCVSLGHEDQKSTPVQESSSIAALEHKHPSPTSYGHTLTIDGQMMDASAEPPYLLPESSSNLKACITDDVGKEVVNLSENQKLKPTGYKISDPASRFSSADIEQKIASQDEISVKKDIELLSGEPFLQDLSIVGGMSNSNKLAAAKAQPKNESVLVAADISVPAAATNSDKKLAFDLNEGFNFEDMKAEDQYNLVTCPFPALSSVELSSSPSLSLQSGSLPTAVTVTAAAKRPFVPPEDLLKNKSQLGWKGSAATSAFRPAEPRKVELLTSSDNKGSFHEFVAPKQDHPVLDIDLNVTDERIPHDYDCSNSVQEADRKTDGKNCKWNGNLKDFSSSHPSAGFELDLNRIDDTLEAGKPSTNQSGKFLSVELPQELNTKRDFDLNDGPSLDDTTVELLAPTHFNFTNMPLHPSFGPRMSSPVVGNISQWCSPAGTACSAPTVPPMLPDSRGEPFQISGAGGSQRMPSVPTRPPSINLDLYRAPMLPSSSALPFGTNALQYPVFPFGTSFQLSQPFLPGGPAGAFVDPSSGARYCAPAIPTQFMGTSGAFSSQFVRPCVANLPNVSASLVDSSGKWKRQALDLNFGPGGGDNERRDAASHMTSRQLHPQVLTEEQARMYQTSGGSLKRKESEGGGETEKLSFKHQLWQ